KCRAGYARCATCTAVPCAGLGYPGWRCTNRPRRCRRDVGHNRKEKEEHVSLSRMNRLYARALACAGGLLALSLLLVACAAPFAASGSSIALADIPRDQALFLLGGE